MGGGHLSVDPAGLIAASNRLSELSGRLTDAKGSAGAGASDQPCAAAANVVHGSVDHLLSVCAARIEHHGTLLRKAAGAYTAADAAGAEAISHAAPPDQAQQW